MALHRALPSPVTLTLSVLATIVGLWLAGFIFFFVSVAGNKPQAPDQFTDVAIVLTGGTGRIEQGFSLMADHKAKAMLVTGVHPNVTLPQLVERWNGERKADLLHHCCIFIEHNAESTEDNAAEALAWLNRNGGPQGVSVRLVTSDYHMPRARLLFHRAMPEATILPWPVASSNIYSMAFLRTVFIEYSKTMLMWLS